MNPQIFSSPALPCLWLSPHGESKKLELLPTATPLSTYGSNGRKMHGHGLTLGPNRGARIQRAVFF